MKKSLGQKTLALPTPVWAINSYDEAGKPNSMIVAWGGIASSGPASLTVSIRPSRHTYAGIQKHGAFTVGVCPQSFAAESDYLGIISGKREDKIAKLGLTPVRSDLVNAPYFEEFPLVIECEVSQTIPVGEHTMFVGGIRDVKCEEEMLIEGKQIDIMKVLPLIFSPATREYYALGERVGKAFSMGKAFMK